MFKSIEELKKELENMEYTPPIEDELLGQEWEDWLRSEEKQNLPIEYLEK